MLKKYHQFVVALFILVDIGLTNLCFVISYYLRFYTNLFDFIQPSRALPQYDYLSGVTFFFISFIWIIVFKFSGLYQPRRGKSLVEEVFTILNAVTLSMFILVVFMFFQRDIEYSRLVIGLFWFLNFVCVASSRTLIRLILREFRKRKYNLRHVIIVGSGKSAEGVIRSLIKHSYYGLNIKGLVDDDENIQNKALYGVKVLGRTKDLLDIVKRDNIDQVFIALPHHQFHKASEIINRLKTEVVDIKLIPDVHELILLRSNIESLDGIPIIDISHTPLTGWNSLVKRIFDVIASMAGLIVFAPLMLLIAILIKLTSRGSVFFSQKRMGIDMKIFNMYKFRTMKEDAEIECEGVTTGWTIKDDPRRTGFGIFLRRSGLDELPQLINVLKGEMSIVGPRPEVPGHVEVFKDKYPEYMLRHKVKSGITGWAQVNGWRGDTSISKRVECDLFYIENWSFKLDMQIIYKTLLTGSFNKNAY